MQRTQDNAPDYAVNGASHASQIELLSVSDVSESQASLDSLSGVSDLDSVDNVLAAMSSMLDGLRADMAETKNAAVKNGRTFINISHSTYHVVVSIRDKLSALRRSWAEGVGGIMAAIQDKEVESNRLMLVLMVAYAAKQLGWYDLVVSALL
ncbi:hypothetical protein DENSPDRAFT_854323 [Dentipellis sp. KUC8613]|nr:hypothetical protein DENSPDRAFT_854323 [Dentipellis sp. KUC8613]